MGFFGNLWKGAKKAFTHVKDGVGQILGDKSGALAEMLGSVIPGVGPLLTPLIKKGFKGFGDMLRDKDQSGGAFAKLARSLG